MNPDKQKRLEAKGWKVGNVDDLLGDPVQATREALEGVDESVDCSVHIPVEDAESLLALIDTLRAEVDDWRDTQRAVMAEDCAPDEKHCTCVPVLRREVDTLRADRALAVEALEEINNGYAFTNIAREALAKLKGGE